MLNTFNHGCNVLIGIYNIHMNLRVFVLKNNEQFMGKRLSDLIDVCKIKGNFFKILDKHP